jgi:hypothetical protein
MKLIIPIPMLNGKNVVDNAVELTQYPTIKTFHYPILKLHTYPSFLKYLNDLILHLSVFVTILTKQVIVHTIFHV